jgi:hypothetical protein
MLCLNYSATAQCTKSFHSTNEKDSWLSCEASTFPNGDSNESYHWIAYDLGASYNISSMHFWNYNVQNQTAKGFKDVEVYYSLDGENWLLADGFQIPEASGTNKYSGWQGPSLAGLEARFISIAAYSNWEGSDCLGLSEVRFNLGDPITSVKPSLEDNLALSIYPNPSAKTINVELKNKETIESLILLNSQGKAIQSRSKSPSITRLNIGTLTPGMYYIKVITKNKKEITKKFIKTSR